MLRSRRGRAAVPQTVLRGWAAVPQATLRGRRGWAAVRRGWATGPQTVLRGQPTYRCCMELEHPLLAFENSLRGVVREIKSPVSDLSPYTCGLLLHAIRLA